MSSRARWTPKNAVRRSQKHIASAIVNLRKVAYEWGDVDEALVLEAEEWIQQLGRWSEAIEEGVKERLAAGEHIGI